jgi:hypothetical protein
MTTLIEPATGAGSFPRIAGVAGLGFATVIVLANVPLQLAGMPLTATDPAATLAFVGSSAPMIRLSAAIAPLAWLLSTLFAVGVVAVLREPDRRRGEGWTVFGLAGVLLQNATFTLVVAGRLATVTAGSDTAVLGLWALQDAVFALNGTFLAMALIGLSLGGLRAGLIGRAQAGLGLIAALLQLASAMILPALIDVASRPGYLGLIGWLLWVAWLCWYGVVLLRRRRPVRTGLPHRATQF